MKAIDAYINEKLVLNKDNVKDYVFNYHPKHLIELRELIENLLEERGKDADLNDIDVSKITKLSPFPDKGGWIGLFEGLDPHNIDISKWDVSNCEGFGAMFYKCENFNCDLSNWDMSNAKYINSMFMDCLNFKGEGLNKWNLKPNVEMNQTFRNCDENIIPNWYKK